MVSTKIVKLLANPVIIWGISSAIVWLGLSCLGGIFPDRPYRESGSPSALRFDALDYLKITNEGYSFNSEEASNVAFFPVFPLMAWVLAKLLALSPEFALLIVSNVAMLVSFLVLHRYLNARPLADAEEISDFDIQGNNTLVLWVFALVPTGFFLRMPYSESCFVLLSLLVFWGIQRKWSVYALALIAGIASATRPVGVALLIPVLIEVAERYPAKFARFKHTIVTLFLGLWGLIGYSAYLWVNFANPLAFMQTQQHWSVRPILSIQGKFVSLASLEPIWGTYVKQSYYFWIVGDGPWVINLTFWNPIYYVSTVVLVLIGFDRKWITNQEAAYSAGLLVIPYLTKSYEWGMFSHGRFAFVAFPAFIVLARILSHCHLLLRIAFFVLCAFLLAIYSHGFSLGRMYF